MSGSVVPNAQSLSAQLSSGSLGFTAGSNASWLSVSPTSGTLGTSATTLSVSVSPGSLSAGTYNGTITVTASGASGSPQTVNVTLNVTAGPSITLPVFTSAAPPAACGLPAGANAFANSVSQIYAWVQFTGAQIGDVVEWDWYDPSSGLQSQTYTTTFAGSGCAWGVISISGNANANKVGTWHVNYLYNGSFKSSNTFVLSGPITTTPTLSVTGGPLTFSYLSGSTIPNAQSLSAQLSSGSLSFTAGSNASWLQVSPVSGTLGTSATTLSVSVSPGSLSSGTYNGTITVTASGASGSPQTVNVTLNVTNAGSTGSSDPDVIPLANTNQTVKWFYVSINNDQTWFIVDATVATNPSVLMLDHVDPLLGGGIAWRPVNNYASFAGYPAASSNFAYINIGSDGRTVSFGPAVGTSGNTYANALANTTLAVKWFYIAINNNNNWYIVDASATSNASVLFLDGVNSSISGGILWKPINNYQSFAGFSAAPTNYSFVSISPDGHSIGFGSLQ